MTQQTPNVGPRNTSRLPSALGRALWGAAASTVLLGVGLMTPSCLQTSSVDCAIGSEGCPCTEAGSCDSGLLCAPGSQTCYNDGSTLARGGTAGNGDGGTTAKGGKTNNGGATVMRPEGPAAECPFPALDGVATLNEELGNPLNQQNGVITPWWLPLEFGTAGGLLRVGETDCTPTTVMKDANAPCSEGYDCGGCPMVWI